MESRPLVNRTKLSLSKRIVSSAHSAYKMCLSPLFGNACRFYPSCSDYAREAVLRHGWLRGGVLACKRVCRCHPWHPGGEDPVPPERPRALTQKE